jgi:galactokinase
VSLEKARELFHARFRREPAVVAAAPGRVNIIGEHTDYNGGEVLPIGIARRTYIAVDRSPAGAHSRAVSATEPDEIAFDAAAPQRTGDWGDYVRGVVSELGARLRSSDMSAAMPSVDVAVWSDVPAGAGLSSSAALEVATATALGALVRAELTPQQVADLAHVAETRFVGVASGIMDQYAAALAREHAAVHLWCDTGDIEHVPMPHAVLIFDTAVPRALRSSAFNIRRAECEEALRLLRRHEPGLRHLAHASPGLLAAARLPEPLARRARHVVEENGRVREMVAALRRREEPPGTLLVASHASLRDDYECSSPELDWFVRRALQAEGVRGARLTGAGWGGCAIAIGPSAALAAAGPAIVQDYTRRFGIQPRSWLTTASAGAEVLDCRP